MTLLWHTCGMKTGVSNLDLTAKKSEIKISRSWFTWEKIPFLPCFCLDEGSISDYLVL